MVEQLFGSKTRVKLLQLFYGNPNRSFYVREITRKIDEQINSVRRELANLLSIGIITSETNNNRLYYEVDQKYHYYEPLANIFGAAEFKPGKQEAGKPTSVTAKTDHPIQSIGHVELTLYTGQFTRDESSGIDVLVVGDINSTQLDKFIADLETREGKEIRYTSMPLSEFYYRQQVNDRFLSLVLAAKSQIIVDSLGLVSPKQPIKTKQAKKEEKK